MKSIRAAAKCIGLDGSAFSVIRHFMGYRSFGQSGTVSIRTQIKLLSGRHIHLNLIRVGNENFTLAAEQQIDRAVQGMRSIYAGIGVGVGRVERWFITEAQANQLLIFNSVMILESVSWRALSDAYTVPNDGIDVFVLLRWDTSPATGTVGRSPQPGPCDKNDDCDATGSVICLEPTPPLTGDLLAHEVGHYLGLPHINGLESWMVDFDGDGVVDLPLPASILKNTMFPILVTDPSNLNGLQGAVMTLDCFMREGC